MRVLVVIPVYNRHGLVTDTLDSVAAQTRQPAAVVVVDDGSTDDTPHAITEWIGRHPELPACLVRSAHRGASAARNLGVAGGCRGMDAVAFLDSDDQWPDDFLARACATLEARPDAMAASTDQEFHYLGESRKTRRSLAEIGTNPWLWMIRNGAGIGSCTLFRLTAFRSAGGYPEEIPTGHDTVLFGRMAACGAWLHLQGKPTVFLRSPWSSGSVHHLHAHYPDHLVRWAEVAHRCWLEAPAKVRTSLEGRKLLSKRWRAAAISARNLRQPHEALRCLGHAIRLRPWSLKNLRLAVSLFGGASSPAR